MNQYLRNQSRLQMNSIQHAEKKNFKEQVKSGLIEYNNKTFQNKQMMMIDNLTKRGDSFQLFDKIKQGDNLGTTANIFYNYSYHSFFKEQVNENDQQEVLKHEQSQINSSIQFFSPQKLTTPQKETYQSQQNFNQVEVEIRQLFTGDGEDKFQIYQIFSCVSEQGKEKQFQSIKTQRQNNVATRIFEMKNTDQLQTDQYNIDQYFNFETPQKIQQEEFIDDNLYNYEQMIQSQQNKLYPFNIYEQKDTKYEIETQNINLINKQADYNQESTSKTTVKKICQCRQIDENTQKNSKEEITSLKQNKHNPKNMFQSQNKTFQKQKTTTTTTKSRLNISNKKIKKKLNFKKNKDTKSYKRGPYKSYSEKLKKKAINDYFRFRDIKLAAQVNQVKTKNLKRWIAVGYKRKEGGGRKKEDPEMEDQVYDWLKQKYYNEQIYVSRNQIREKALQLSNKKDKFKASKGWLEKFFARYNCKFMCKKDQTYDFKDNLIQNDNNFVI